MKVDNPLSCIESDESIPETVLRLHDEAFAWLCNFEIQEYERLLHTDKDAFEMYKMVGNSGRAIICFKTYKEYQDKFLIWCGLQELLKVFHKE